VHHNNNKDLILRRFCLDDDNDKLKLRCVINLISW
jgi:hypothetical protein